LYICGPIDNEPQFKKIYYKELFQTPNITTYGFVKLNSKKFYELMRRCAFVIFPSCSEGGSPSVLNCIGNGGLIPIVSKYATITTGYEFLIEDLTVDAISKVIIENMSELSDKNLQNISVNNFEYVSSNHSIEKYKQELYLALKKILGS